MKNILFIIFTRSTQQLFILPIIQVTVIFQNVKYYEIIDGN